jgi:hypothetical protein
LGFFEILPMNFASNFFCQFLKFQKNLPNGSS